MFRALQCPSSGAHDYDVDYHISWFRSVKDRGVSVTERNDQCGNQHYSRELLMMGTVVPETC